MTENGFAASVMLIGATGQVGKFVLPRLQADRLPIVALSRSAGIEIAERATQEAGQVNWIHPDAGKSGQTGIQCARLQSLLGEVTVLLSVGPVKLAGEWASRCPQLQRVVCLSTSSVHTKRDSRNDPERLLIDQICRAEDSLKNLCSTRNIALALLRPTLIYGAGLDRNVSRIAGIVRRFHFFPVAGRAKGLRQPIHANDLAELVVYLAKHQPAISIQSEVAGGSTLSYLEMVERIFVAIGMRPRIVSVPPRLLAALVSCVAWLPGFRDMNSGFVLRQNTDQVFDDRHLRELTGFSPRPFNPTSTDV